MAEIHVSTDEQYGIKKEIDEGAYGLIFQAIQEDIYSYPIRSFVRETISNGLDSIIEREQAKDIILNGAEPSKYYRQLHNNQLLKDSSFDRDYYDVKKLSSVNTVKVTYKEQSGRDLISIKDYGVGLGGSRLKGYFKIGYSSKRNMKSVMGKFGSGSKSGLATGVAYFVLRTVYNGYETAFMIYKNDYEPVTPKSEEGLREEWHVTMANEDKKVLPVYWTKTNKCNSVTVELEVKKHNKEAFMNAVIDQFQYFNGKVILRQESQYLVPTERVLNSTPYYESDVLLIPTVSTYSAPHILVDGINYGLVSWEELELNKRYGKIAIKVSASSVDITQSRESLKWTEKTKATILNAIKLAEEEASDHMTNVLTLDDKENIFEFNNKYSATRKDSTDNTTYAFSMFLDMYKVKPKFTFTMFKGYDREVTLIKPLNIDLFQELFYKFSVKIVKVEARRKGKVSIESDFVQGFSSIVNLPIVFADESSLGVKRAQYLINSRFPDNDSFVYIRSNPAGKERNFARGWEEKISTDDIKLFMEYNIKKCCTINLDDENWDEIESELSNTVEVTGTEETREKYRRDNKLVLYQEYPDYSANHRRLNNYNSSYEKKEIKIKEIKSEFEDEELIICTGTYRHLGKILDSIKYIMGTNQKIIYVSQQVVKLFLPYGTFITDYIRTYNPKTKKLMVGTLLRNLGTLNKFHKLLVEYKEVTRDRKTFLRLTNVDEEKYKNLDRKQLGHTTLKSLLTNSFNNDKTTVDTIIDYIELVTKFQEVLNTGDEILILEESKKLFNGEEVFNLNSYDEEFIATLDSELKRVNVCSPLIYDLTYNVKEETIELIKELINFKNSNNDNI